jgi:two-component sensor histidine kinase
LQAQQEVMQAQQEEIHQKNKHLSEVLVEKDTLLLQKDTLISEKEGLLKDKIICSLSRIGLLEEKERLLKEIHHRSKQPTSVMSLLNSQAASLKDQLPYRHPGEPAPGPGYGRDSPEAYQSEGVARIPWMLTSRK